MYRISRNWVSPKQITLGRQKQKIPFWGGKVIANKIVLALGKIILINLNYCLCSHTGIKFRHNLWTWMDPPCWIFTSFSWGGSHHYCLGQVKQGVGSHPLWIRTGCGHFSSLAPRGILTRWTWHYTVLSLIWNLGRIRFKNNWTF